MVTDAITDEYPPVAALQYAKLMRSMAWSIQESKILVVTQFQSIAIIYCY